MPRTSLVRGELTVKGRMPWSSNGTYLVEVCLDGDTTNAVYKPHRGERPLWDFPGGLYKREVAAYELSDALGWDIVPRTVLRAEGPMGEGSLQQFVDADFEQHYFTLYEDGELHRPAADHVRVRPAGQQHRPQERPLPARRRTATSGASTTG